MLPNLYEVTNKLGKIVLRQYENGIRYCSVFYPYELTGGKITFTLFGQEFCNLALTDKGYKFLKLFSVEQKVCENLIDISKTIEIFSNIEKREHII